jgi:hypothetical protein
MTDEKKYKAEEKYAFGWTDPRAVWGSDPVLMAKAEAARQRAQNIAYIKMMLRFAFWTVVVATALKMVMLMVQPS